MSLYSGSASFSQTSSSTIDGLRVALAGLPARMPVQVDNALDLKITDVSELRSLDDLPCPLVVIVPNHIPTLLDYVEIKPLDRCVD